VEEVNEIESVLDSEADADGESVLVGEIDPVIEGEVE
jgi:hypothetical protein